MSMYECANCEPDECTTVETNSVENYLLKKNGWKIINRFYNRRTGHKCLEWNLELPEKI